RLNHLCALTRSSSTSRPAQYTRPSSTSASGVPPAVALSLASSTLISNGAMTLPFVFPASPAACLSRETPDASLRVSLGLPRLGQPPAALLRLCRTGPGPRARPRSQQEDAVLEGPLSHRARARHRPQARPVPAHRAELSQPAPV